MIEEDISNRLKFFCAETDIEVFFSRNRFCRQIRFVSIESFNLVSSRNELTEASEAPPMKG